jgi:hypothetical protein
MLLVLDNARNADQVRLLLPTGTGSTALVTSRHRMDSLAVHDGAAVLRLGAMARADSIALVTRLVGRDLWQVAPEHAQRMAQLCEDTPLALRIAAARLATRPSWAPADLVAELADERRRLETLSTPDAEIGIATSLAATYRTLSEPSARLFVLLAVHPGDDIDPYAAAALANMTPEAGRHALANLAAVHLLNRSPDNRYHWPDLVGLYSRSLAAELVGEGERETAVGALLGYYVAATGTARQAVTTSARDRPPIGRAASLRPRFDSSGAALAWFDHEEATITALVGDAVRTRYQRETLALVDNVAALHVSRGATADFTGVAASGLAAARLIGDPISMVLGLHAMAVARTDAGPLDRAIATFADAQRWVRRLDDPDDPAALCCRLDHLRALARGEHADIDTVDELLAGAHFPVGPYYSALRLGYQAHAMLATGRRDGCVELAEKGLAIIDEEGLESIRHLLLHAAGRALLAADRHVEARHALVQARKLAADLGDTHTETACAALLDNNIDNESISDGNRRETPAGD